MIESPTCFKGSTPTVLDLILVSNRRKYIAAMNTKFHLSDFHNIIGAATRRFAPSQKPNTVYYRSYKHFNEHDYTYDLSTAPFYVADMFDDIDDRAWFTSTCISNIIDEHAPVKSKIIKTQSVPYMNSRLRKAQYKRNMVRNKFRKFVCLYWEENRKERTSIVTIRKQSIAKYFADKCVKQDTHFWSTISPFISDKKFRSRNEIILEESNETIVNPQDVADTFNNFFTNIASSIGFDDIIVSVPESLNKHQDHPSVKEIAQRHDNVSNSFHFHHVTPDEIRLKLKQINVRKATGFDNIPGKLLRLGYRELCYPLANLINVCISRNRFPEVMKCAEMSPIFKKDDNLNKNNYRPVSVLTGISKIYETVLNK